MRSVTASFQLQLKIAFDIISDLISYFLKLKSLVASPDRDFSACSRSCCVRGTGVSPRVTELRYFRLFSLEVSTSGFSKRFSRFPIAGCVLVFVSLVGLTLDVDFDFLDPHGAGDDFLVSWGVSLKNDLFTSAAGVTGVTDLSFVSGSGISTMFPKRKDAGFTLDTSASS